MSETIEPGTSLAVIPAASLPMILAADENDIFGKLFAELSGHEGDGTTPKGRRECISKSDKVSTAKANLLRIARTLKEDHIRIHKAIVAEERVITERFDALRDQIRAPVTEYENREKQRVADHRVGIATIEGWIVYPDDWTSDRIADHIASIQTDALLTRDWQEFKAKAEDAVARSLNTLKRRYQEAAKREAEARELAELRAQQAERKRLDDIAAQQAREKQIADEAAETARLATEAKAQAALNAQALAAEEERNAGLRRERGAADALARAEREKAAAEERGRLAAEKALADAAVAEQKAIADAAAAVEAERQRVARQAAAQKAEDDRRAADKAHRGRINREASEAIEAILKAPLFAIGTTRPTQLFPETLIARQLITAIAKGEIPHIRVEY